MNKWQIENTELEKFECAECDITFVLEWRLKKHARIHTSNKLDLRYCHYFNNDKTCPHAKLGCMFMHESAPNCKYMEGCSKILCPYKHSDFAPSFEEEKKSAENMSSHSNAIPTKELIDEEGFELYVDNCFSDIYQLLVCNS